MICGNVVIDAAQQILWPTDVKAYRLLRQCGLVNFDDGPAYSICVIWQLPQCFDAADFAKIKRAPRVQQKPNVSHNCFLAVFDGFLYAVAAGIASGNIRYNHTLGGVIFIFEDCDGIGTHDAVLRLSEFQA